MTYMPFGGAAAPVQQSNQNASLAIVINVISFRELPSAKRAELLDCIHDAGEKGARLFFSVRTYDESMDTMMKTTLPFVVPNEQDRARFYHNEQLLFSQEELRRGAESVMQQTHADIYLACAPYEHDVPALNCINLKAEDFLPALLRVLEAKADEVIPQPDGLRHLTR